MSGLPDALRRPVKGMRDLPPEEYYALREMEERLSRTAELFGYRRLETPAVEHFEVLARKAGPDVVNEIYYFRDKAGRELGLRFDMTVPVARFVSYRMDMPRPLRLYYFSKVWRYDEPQHGRYREFHQFGVELIGSRSHRADVEVLHLLAESLRAAGAASLQVKVNDRRAVDRLLERYGVADRAEAYRALDKRGKVPDDEVVAMLQRAGLDAERARRLYEEASAAVDLAEAPSLLSRLDPQLASHYAAVAKLLDRAVGLGPFKFDMSVVRGLDYYTGLVFEAYVGDYRLAVGGGGRYDDLIGLYSGVPTPSLGFAVGVERLMEALGATRAERPVDYYIYIFDDEAYPAAAEAARALRAAGRSVVVELGEKSLKDAFEYALKTGVRYIAMIGRRELERGVVRVRDLARREERDVPLSQLAQVVT